MPKYSAAHEKKVRAAPPDYFWCPCSTGHDFGWISEKGRGKQNLAPDGTVPLPTNANQRWGHN